MEMELGKLFIGGISWDTNEDRLREYFQTFGEVVEAVIMKDRATGRARGFGFVVFADAAVAEGVVMEKHIIDGRTVEAKKAVPKNDQHILSKSTISIHGSPGPLRTKKIFVGGLASTVTESEFKKYFDHFGTITDVVVMYDHNTQRPRGFGFITYDSEEAVEKVLVKTFHELNGKMVEVKRAVPKELSPSLNRAQLGGYNCGLGVSNFLSGHSQGYNPASVGSYGLRMDSRFCPITVGRSGVSPFGSAGYGMGLNFEVGLSPSYGGSAGSTPNLSSVRASNSYYNGNSNRYSSPIGFSTGIGGTGSILSPTRRNMWGNGNLNLSSSANSSAFMSSGSGSLGTSSLGSIGAIWSSPVSGQGGRINSAYSSGNISYSNMNFELGGGRYGRSGRASGAPASSYAASTVGYDGAYGNFDEVGSIYGDSTWQSSSSELEMSRSFGHGFENAASEVAAKNAASYIGGYGVTNRQANSGIAA